MTTQQRIEKIEKFIHLQRYLHGCFFHVLEEGDGFVVEFQEASKRQLATLNHRLRSVDMDHIRCRAIKVIEFEKKNFKKHKKH